jgi:thiol-disulfide isomerase/thioredoxin
VVRSWYVSASIAILAWLLVGCQTHSFRLFSWKERISPDATHHGIPLLDQDQLRQRISHLKGKVVLVDYWATWCPPCRAAMPHTLELAQRHAPDGLALITVAFNDADQGAQVADFLRNSGADHESHISRYGQQKRSFDEFHIQGGAIPYFQLYDRQGILRYSFTGASAELDQRVAELIRETGQGAG